MKMTIIDLAISKSRYMPGTTITLVTPCGRAQFEAFVTDDYAANKPIEQHSITFYLNGRQVVEGSDLLAGIL